MYNTSAEYKSKIIQPSKDYDDIHVSGTITLSDSTIITILDNDIKELKTSNQCSPDDGFDIGFSATGEMQLSIYDSANADKAFKGAVIELTYYLKTSETDYEGVPLGIYTVSEATRSTANSISLTAYDNMTKFDVDYPLADKTTNKTPFERLKDLCTACGVELWEDDINVQALLNSSPNGNISHNLAFSPEISTARDYLDAICQLLCAFATIDRAGKLKIQCWKWLGDAQGYTIPDSLRKSTTINDTQFGYNQLNMQVSYLQSSSIKTITAPAEPVNTGDMLYCYTNPLIRAWLYSDAQTILDNVAECLCNTDPDYSGAIMRWYPCTVEYTGDPAIEVGDWMTYTGYTAGDGITVPIHKIDWTYRGYQTLVTVGAVVNNTGVNSQRSMYEVAASAATTVIDNLSSTSTSAALSANQGRVLNDKISAIDTTSPDDWDYAIIEPNSMYLKRAIRILGYKGSETLVEVPSYIDGYPVTEIGTGEAYKDTTGTDNIIELTIPDTVQYINDYAFYCSQEERKLQILKIGNGCLRIGKSAFAHNWSLYSIDIRSASTIDDSAFTNCMYDNTPNWKGTLSLPNNLKIVGGQAFKSAINLESLQIPEGVKSIGGGAFSELGRITELTVPSGISDLETTVFESCTSLTKIIVKSAVDVPNYFCRSCSSLKEIWLSPDIKKLGTDAFKYIAPNADVYLSKNCTTTGAFNGTVNFHYYENIDDKPVFINIFSSFPEIGSEYHLYVATDTNKIYKYTSSGYVEIANSGQSVNIINALDSTSTVDALSANMGRVLNNKIGDISTILASVVEG